MPRLSITLTDDQHAALERISAATGATKQSMIGLAITAWVRENDVNAPATKGESTGDWCRMCEDAPDVCDTCEHWPWTNCPIFGPASESGDEPFRRPQYERQELLAFLGDFAEDFDVEAIEREATEYERSTGRTVWTVDHDELAAICERHDRTHARKPPRWVAYARMWSPKHGDAETIPSTHDTEGDAIAAAKAAARQAKAEGWRSARPMWYLEDEQEDR